MSEMIDTRAQADALEWLVKTMLARQLLSEPNPASAAREFADETQTLWDSEAIDAMKRDDALFDLTNATHGQLTRILADVVEAVETAAPI